MNLIPKLESDRLQLGTLIINIATLLLVLVNSILPAINLKTGLLGFPYLFPAIRPLGTDFREGLFFPAKYLLEGKNPYLRGFPYPPFASIFATPFRLFNVQNAYLIHVILLFLAIIAIVYTSVKIAEYVSINAKESRDFKTGGWIVDAIFLPVTILTLFSYGFIFTVERGNFDPFPLLFLVLSLWVLLTKPDRLWLQTLLVGIATHLKVYPAVLFSLILWKHGRKSILPLIAVNAALLFMTGPLNVVEFFRKIIPYSQGPFIWIGNHSATSFSTQVNNFLSPRLNIEIPALFFSALPLLLWGAGALVLWRRNYSPINATYLYALSIPVMNLLPSTSHDYKLVLLSSPLAIVLFLTLYRFTESGRPLELVKLLTLLFLLIPLTRSYTMLPVALGNKYPFILLFQFVVFVTILDWETSGEPMSPRTVDPASVHP